MSTITKLTIATAAAFACTMTFDVPASLAYGDAPWCAVISSGTGDIHWDCYYRTVEECQPNVIAGNRGFCNLNPWPSPAMRAATPSSRHKTKRRAQQS